jgi:hypothetical protein
MYIDAHIIEVKYRYFKKVTKNCTIFHSTANPAHLPQNWAKSAVLFSSKRAPRNLIFSIAMDADNSFYVKSIATYAPHFFGYIISVS